MIMNKRLQNTILLLASTVLLCTSCLRSDEPPVRREIAVEKLLKKEHRIKIAIASPWGQKRNYLKEGLQLACEELNEQGGVLGAKIELLAFDDNNNRATGSRVAYQIADDEEIAAVIGHSSSSVSMSNSLIYHYYGLLMFSPLSTSKNLTHYGLPYVFRNIPSDDEFGIQAASFCEKSSWKRVMIYYINNSYGESLANAFELQCGGSGISVLDRVSFENVYGVRDYLETIKNWKDNYIFDAIFIAGSLPQVGEIVSIFRANGITQPIIGGDAFDMPIFFKIADNIKEDQVYAISNYDTNNSSPVFESFKNAFYNRYGFECDQAAYQGYDALMVLGKAIEKAGSVRKEDIAKALRETPLWEEVAGPYKFDEYGNIIGHKLVVKKTSGGEFKVVE